MEGEIRQVALGSTFRTTWVSSGATASPIVYNIFSGSETMVASYAGVSSGNGHYYVEAAVNTTGLWQGSWFAYVSPNSYRANEVLTAFPYDTDQPGRYVTWNDIVNRHESFGGVAGAIKAASHYLHYAEGEVDSRLGVEFSTPFSNNNVTVRDLVIDIVYLRASRFKTDGWKELKEDIDARIAALNSGTAVMIIDSGTSIAAGAGVSTPAWSSTQDYHPVFAATLDYIDMMPSSAQLQAEADERGL